MNPEDFQQRWFKSDPIPLGIESANIDADNGILRDVIMAEEGPAKGHGVNLEREFIENMTAYDQQVFGKTGQKARFGHPNASNETMGTQLGVFTNFRIREQKGKLQEIADLTLLNSANISPTHPKMKDWVLSMADERPDFIMSSIVFSPSGYYQRTDDGSKQYLEFDEWTGRPINLLKDRVVFVEFDKKRGAAKHYTDIVEAGAATNKLFSSQVNTHLFAAQVDEFLSEHPHLLEFLKTNPDAVGRWLSRAGYSINTQHKKTMSKFNFLAFLKGEAQADGATPTADDLTEIKEAFSQARTEYESLRKERDDFKTKFEAASKQAEQLSNDTKSLRTELDKLAADLKELTSRVEVVEKKPADEHTGGEALKPLSTGKTKGKLWESFKEAHDIP